MVPQEAEDDWQVCAKNTQERRDVRIRFAAVGRMGKERFFDGSVNEMGSRSHPQNGTSKD